MFELRGFELYVRILGYQTLDSGNFMFEPWLWETLCSTRVYARGGRGVRAEGGGERWANGTL